MSPAKSPTTCRQYLGLALGWCRNTVQPGSTFCSFHHQLRAEMAARIPAKEVAK